MGLTSQKQKAAVYAKIEVFQKKADVDSHRITVSEQTEPKKYKCVPKARVETAPEKHNCSNDELLKWKTIIRDQYALLNNMYREVLLLKNALFEKSVTDSDEESLGEQRLIRSLGTAWLGNTGYAQLGAANKWISDKDFSQCQSSWLSK